jgi:phosphonate transport system ATP-binding protein
MACRASLNRHDRVTSRQRCARTVAAIMTVPMSPVISVDGAGKVYGSNSALDAVSATIHPGQFVAIIGRSGAGKTTLLRCLAFATPLTRGSIRFGDVDLTGLHGRALRIHRRRVGMIYQQFNLVKRLRVIDNVLVGRLGHVRGWRRWAVLARRFSAVDRDVALRCLYQMGLLDRAWQRADTLSGGEQQRVAIARILAQQPRVILADEPVASLDVLNGRRIMDSLRRVATAANLTVVATLHHVDYARAYADRILGLRAGRLVFNGTPADLDAARLVEIFGELPEPLDGREAGALAGLASP